MFAARGICATCAAKVVGVACSFEALGAGRDAGHYAYGCGAAQLQRAGLGGRCFRTATSERSNAAAIQAHQVSST